MNFQASQTAPVNVLFFSSAKVAAGVSSFTMSCARGLSQAEFWEELLAEFSGLRAVREQVRLAINGEFAAAATNIYPGDEVALIPPVSGG